MNIDNTFLQSFVEGTLYFRYPCFDHGPDYHYLFRSRIDEIELDNGEINIVVTPLPKPRFMLGEWTEHKLDEKMIHHFKKHSSPLFGNFPKIRIISANTIYMQVDTSGEAVIRSPDVPEPDVTDVFEHFPESYSKVLGALGDLRGLF